MAAKPKPRWCAVYTRKSSEEGLDQEFNSLDAQREAGAAYVKSQASEGWRLVRARYDDGGYSGGNMERPGLARLLTDIRTGKIDTVVVYKVDRLTRSLGDFARLIELFEERGVSFVSVTQQFNTTTSMGRLMLNVLLSFAQFEREVTGERIRDKVAASKKKGMWMGGMPPIAYNVTDKKLIVAPGEAKTVRHIFRRYAELGCVSKLMRDLETTGYRTKHHTSSAGKVTGGRRFARGHLYGILANRLYLGQVVHKGESYPGEHDAIIDQQLWDKVHEIMKSNRRAFRKDERTVSPSLLKSVVFDDAGNRMSPSHAQKEGRRYRYYVSQAILQQRAEEAGSLPRLPAHDLEHLVVRAVLDLLKGIPKMRAQVARIGKLGERETRALVRRVVTRVTLSKHQAEITFDPSRIDPDSGQHATRSDESAELEPITTQVPLEVTGRGGKTHVVLAGDRSSRPVKQDPALIRAMARGFRWREQLLSGKASSIKEIARSESIDAQYVMRILRLAFLVPDITEAILAGRQPAVFSQERLRHPIPLAWDEQRKVFGFSTP